MAVETRDVGERDLDRHRSDDGPAPIRRERAPSGMEIGDYIRIIKKRFWAVVAIPTIAVLSMTAIVLARPATYSAVATVSAPSLISDAPGAPYATSNGSSQFVADFVAAISVDPVVDAVGRVTETDPQTIRENTTATPLGESTLIEVRYETTNQAKAQPVVRALARETLRFLFLPAAIASSTTDQGTVGGSSVDRLELLLSEPRTISVSPTRADPRGPDLIRGVQIAIGGGLLLALLVIILLELLPLDPRRSRGQRPAHRAASFGRTAGEPEPKVPQESNGEPVGSVEQSTATGSDDATDPRAGDGTRPKRRHPSRAESRRRNRDSAGGGTAAI